LDITVKAVVVRDISSDFMLSIVYILQRIRAVLRSLADRV